MPRTHRDYEPVVITGIGAVSPLGHSFDAIAESLLAGRSGVRSIDPGPLAREPVQFAGAVTDIPPPPTVAWPLDAASFDALPRLDRLCASPIAHALADAGLADERSSRCIGLVLGLGAEHLKAWEADYLGGGRRVLEPAHGPSLAQRLAGCFGLSGPAMTTAAACASSGYAMAMGRTWLDAGWVDACIVGGCDTLSHTALAAFYNLRALSRRGDDPAKASRPFDRDRDGFVMGEGGACFVLERRSEADRRGRRIYGELAGVGMSSDASHMVAPCTDPVQAARAISMAIEDAGITAAEIDYVNAHAAGTPVGDAAEAGAIRMALGDETDRVPVSSTKSMSGHLVSGAAAFEAVACLVAIDRQAIPPTVNLDEPDGACRLNHVPHVARQARVRVAASNSFGFGGSNLCLVIRAAA
ncbi:MAG: beta-ketoacyl-[acyl-carrier-protein] synthase family protein [Planctomycetia bacterium]